MDFPACYTARVVIRNAGNHAPSRAFQAAYEIPKSLLQSIYTRNGQLFESATDEGLENWCMALIELGTEEFADRHYGINDPRNACDYQFLHDSVEHLPGLASEDVPNYIAANGVKIWLLKEVVIPQ